MSLKLINENINALFDRKESVFALEDSKIPSKDEARQMIADHYKINLENIRIIDIVGTFGAHIVKIRADVYGSLESFNKYVKKTKKELAAEKKAAEEKLKAEAEAKKKVEEAAAEEAAKIESEKPVEEVKEEASE